VILALLIHEYLPADFSMPQAQIIREIALTLLLPLVIGMTYLYLWPASAAALSKWSIRGSMLGILLIVLGSVSAGRLDVAVFGYANVLLVTLFALLLAVIAYWLPRLLRLSKPDAIAIEIEVIVRNVNLGILMKASLFPAALSETAKLGDMVLLTLLLYGGLQLLVGAALIWRYRRRKLKSR
jgi:BASS family bile acid:Na+ symporter